MDPEQKSTAINTENTAQKTDPKKDEKYAEALAAQAMLDYKMQQANRPETKHFISKKMLVYIVVSVIITIISMIFMGGGSDQKKAQDSAKTQQLIDGAQELQDAQNGN